MTRFIRMRTYKEVCKCDSEMTDEVEIIMVEDGYEAINPDHIIKHYPVHNGDYRCIHLSDGTQIYITLQAGIELDSMFLVDTTLIKKTE